ncbi:MAG: DMT family transporter [Clostridia bacterium]|nr:DMT family transporter [Clostridia bacterium]
MNRLLFVLSMVIFATIGIFVSPLSVPSSVVALFRAGLGTLVLWLVISFTGRKIDKDLFRHNAKYLIPSGIALGFNWVLLFEGYKLTGVAIATLCYYLAPAIVIILSPIFLKERLTKLKVICVVIAFLGMIPVSGVLTPDAKISLKGIGLSLLAAILYAMIVLLNKKVSGFSGIETTVIQLGISTVVMALYVFFAEPLSFVYDIGKDFGRLLLLGVVHTGIAYLLYFTAIKRIKAVDAALFSYIDPAGALILSYTVLDEKFTYMGLVGIIMIIGASLLAEIPAMLRKSK